jgi:uncharacterized protein (DUF488 family)
MAVFFTIGHSTRSLDEFIAILRQAGVETLVDVRAIPRSRTNPQFNQDALPAALAAAGIRYVHVPELGGRRSRRKGDAPSPNDFWENASFRNYADYAMGAPFRAGLEKLRSMGQTSRCAIMCAEAVWWRCHRRIIADYLLNAGEEVIHLVGPGREEPAHMTPAAREIEPGVLVYSIGKGGGPIHTEAAVGGRLGSKRSKSMAKRVRS